MTKQGFRQAVGRVVGWFVRLGGVLGGTGGALLDAQEAVAEAEVEEAIDHLDGKG